MMEFMKTIEKIKKLIGYLMLKTMFSVLLTHMQDILKLWKK